MKSFVVVDDHEFLLDAISFMIESRGNFVVGKFLDFEDAYNCYNDGLRSDYAIIDFYSVNSNALNVIKKIRSLGSDTFIVVISYVDSDIQVDKIINSCSPDLFIRKSKLKEGLIKLLEDAK